MKKDIQIPKVEGLYVAVVNEHNETYNTDDWNAYLINDMEVDLDMVLIVSVGYNKDKITSTMRHKIECLPKKSYAKIEWLQEDTLALNNEYKITFFEGNQMFDKVFLFRKNTINLKALQDIPLMNSKGVLVK